MSDPERVLSLVLKLSSSKVRALVAELESKGVFLVYQETTGELCSRCAAHLAGENGFCVRCEEAERQQERARRDEQERAELEAVMAREANRLKKERERWRDELDANPRKKTLLQWLDWAIENPDQWEVMRAKRIAEFSEE